MRLFNIWGAVFGIILALVLCRSQTPPPVGQPVAQPIPEASAIPAPPPPPLQPHSDTNNATTKAQEPLIGVRPPAINIPSGCPQIYPTGTPLPVPDTSKPADLIIREDILKRDVVQSHERFDKDDCSAIEDNLSPGLHRVLRFSVGTSNIGEGPVFLGDPKIHNDSGTGLVEWAPCHKHFHYRHYALYELIGPNGHKWKAAKKGFCLIDSEVNPPWLPGFKDIQDELAHSFISCEYQGLSAGWTDTYGWNIPGQFFVLDGGDGQPVVEPGEYTLRVTANPPFTPEAGELCRHKDSKGLCHNLWESNYDNNVGEVKIRITNDAVSVIENCTCYPSTRIREEL